MQTRHFRYGSVAIAIATLSGCGITSGPPKTPEGLLAGTGWRLEQLGGQGAIEGNQPTLSFVEAGKVSGSGSCNQFNGPVTVNGKSISIGTLASARMACSGALNAQESMYLKALQQAEWFTVLGNSLTIYTRDQPLMFLRTSPP